MTGSLRRLSSRGPAARVEADPLCPLRTMSWGADGFYGAQMAASAPPVMELGRRSRHVLGGAAKHPQRRILEMTRWQLPLCCCCEMLDIATPAQNSSHEAAMLRVHVHLVLRR